MIKIYPLPMSLVLIALSGNANAQLTQMIIDDNNRIMPIFFHDNENQLPSPPQVNQHQAPLPAPAQSIVPRDPLTGPYFISPQRHRIMAAAHASLGTPYIYGGNNPARGLDCSSLMQFIHKQALDVSIPRTAAQQRNHSKTIDYSRLQPGDMLFFKIDRSNNHVGIYIGGGKFIHASASNRRATITSMSLPYWKKRFVKFGSYLDI